LGLAAWQWRKHLAGLGRLLGGFGQLATDGFGFESLNRGIVNATLKAADTIRPLQTGLLNWNVVGILGGLVVVLAWLAWSTGIGR